MTVVRRGVFGSGCAIRGHDLIAVIELRTCFAKIRILGKMLKKIAFLLNFLLQRRKIPTNTTHRVVPRLEEPMACPV